MRSQTLKGVGLAGRSLRSPRLTRYARLAEALLHAIRMGRYPIGTFLPTEHELSTTHRVSRATVREALSRLEESGFIARSQGVGTRVLADHERVKYVLAGHAATDGMSYDAETALVVREQRTIRANTALAARLGVPAGSEWVHVHGLRTTVAGSVKPLAVTDMYIAPAYADMVASLCARARPIYERIEISHGVRIARIWQDVTATTLTTRQARALRAEPGATALHVLRRFFVADAIPVEVTVNIHPADRFTFSLRLDQA